MAEMDLFDSCNICGEDHSTESCPELGLLDSQKVELDLLSTRARLTLPEWLEVVDNGNGVVGVVTKVTLPAKTQMGPYEAKRTTHIFDDVGFFTLKLISKDGTTVCLDTTDENECNWLCLVRAAVSQPDQNCMAYQLGTNIYYNTTRDVMAGEELQVWYAPNFARKLGKQAETDGTTRVLLGHRIEPLTCELTVDPDTQSSQTQDTTEATEDVVYADKETGTVDEQMEAVQCEIRKAFYCPRCGHTYSSQSEMVQCLREHVLGNPSSSSTGRRGRGRPRIHPVQGTEQEPKPKRGRGRPRKHPDDSSKPGFVTHDQDQSELLKIPNKTYGRKRQFSDIEDENDEEFDVSESDDNDETEVEILAEKRLKLELVVDDDLDKDYTPVKEVSLPTGGRKNPRRSTRGRHSKFDEDYVFGKFGKRSKDKIKIEGDLDKSVDSDIDDSALSDTITEVNNDITDTPTVRKGRGRPKKIKELENKETGNFENLDGTLSEDIEKILKHEGKAVVLELGTDAAGKDPVTNQEVKNESHITGSIMVNDKIQNPEPAVILNPSTNESDNTTFIVIQPIEKVKSDIQDSEKNNSEFVEIQVDKKSEAAENETVDSTLVMNGIINEEGEEETQNETVVMFEEVSDDMYGCVLCGEKFKQEIDAISHFMNHQNSATKCKKCGQEFTNQESLTNHSPSCTGTGSSEVIDTKHVCDICQQSFKTDKYLYRHMVMHTDMFTCIECKKTFSRKDSMQKHILKCCPHAAESYNIYYCDLCSRVFSTAIGKTKHLKKCKSVQCSVCLKIFTSQEDLEMHKCQKGDNEDSTVGKYSCGICPKSFQSLHYLKQHRSLHEKLHTCDRCGKSRPSADELEEHKALCQTLEAIKSVGVGKCDKCVLEFNSAKHFREHYLSHSHPFQCEFCSRRFIKVGTLSSHDCQPHVTDGFICDLCSRTFKTQVNLDRHRKEHGCIRYACSACQKQFKTKAQAVGHECVNVKTENGENDTEGESETPIAIATIQCIDAKEVCPTCGKSFSTRSNLTKHLLLHGEKNFTCPHCQKRFHLEVYLKEHITCVHYNIFKYQCTHCGKMLKSKTGLIAHTNLAHAKNSKTFPCKTCGKKFKQKGNLRTHMYSHSTERNFVCTVCERAFKYPDQLSRHSLEHRIVSKLGCKHCDKQFLREYELKKHVQIFHSGYAYVCGICSSRCGHRHTLVRHYKRKHHDSCYLLHTDGYIDGLLKQVGDAFPNDDLDSGGLQHLEIDNTLYHVQVKDPAVTETDNSDELPREAAEALHSLAMGTVTEKQYRILQENHLFQYETVEEQVQQTGFVENLNSGGEQTVIVSQGGDVVHSQVVLQGEHFNPEDAANISTVTVDGQQNPEVVMTQNPDGTISFKGISSMSQTIDGFDGGEGQIVILQIVDPEAPGEIIQGMVQGEIIGAADRVIEINNSGELINENAEIIVGPREVVHDSGEVVHDSGEVVHDSGEVIHDSGEVIQDSGELIHDSGEVVHDSGEVVHDSGEVIQDSGEVIQDSGELIHEIVQQYDVVDETSSEQNREIQINNTDNQVDITTQAEQITDETTLETRVVEGEVEEVEMELTPLEMGNIEQIVEQQANVEGHLENN